MPSYSDPVDAATVRYNLGQEIRSTDVWHDRNWLMANIQRGPRDPMAHAAEIALHNLDRQEARQERYGIAQQALAQRGQALDQRAAELEQRDIHFEANQRRLMAHDVASEAHNQLTIDRNTEIDEQGASALQHMLKLDGALRRGDISKDQYDDGLLEVGQAFPMAMRHPEAAKHFNFAIEEADKQNAYNIRRQATQAAKLGAKYGIEPQVDPETGLPSVEHTQLAALQTPKGKVEAIGLMNREMNAKYGVPTGVGSLFNPIQPHSSDDENQTINIPYADPKAEGGFGKLKVPYGLFNQMKSDFNDRYFALNPQSATQAGAESNTGAQSAPATIRMRAPNGMVRDVTPDQVDHFTKLGATLEQ